LVAFDGAEHHSHTAVIADAATVAGGAYIVADNAVGQTEDATSLLMIPPPDLAPGLFLIVLSTKVNVPSLLIAPPRTAVLPVKAPLVIVMEPTLRIAPPLESCADPLVNVRSPLASTQRKRNSGVSTSPLLAMVELPPFMVIPVDIEGKPFPPSKKLSTSSSK
jgi:hypothetical protein